jgi:hypothetical protein
LVLSLILLHQNKLLCLQMSETIGFTDFHCKIS